MATGLIGMTVLLLGPPELTDPEPVVSAPTEVPVVPTPAPSVAPTVAPTAAAARRSRAGTAQVSLSVTILAAPQPTPTPEQTANDWRQITWLSIPSIDLETDVVAAPIVENDDSLTWDIPKFVAGHAESSAGAGEVGNAVVLGHLVSRTLGNVFEHLDRTQPGDTVQVRSGSQQFVYTVVDVADVDRTDVDVLDSTATPTITLITCAGVWNPMLHDYMERLVVRGELVSAE